MIEFKDLTKVEHHLTALGLVYIKPPCPGGQGFWVLPETWDETKRCPFAIVSNQVGWLFDFYFRVCNKYFKVESAADLLTLNADTLNVLVDRANESEFQIARVQRTTVEIVTKLLEGCVHVE